MRVLKKYDVKLIQVSNYSFFFEKKAFDGRTIKQSFRIIFKMRLINYFHRIMCILNLFPKIHLHFECDQKRIDLINQSISKRLDRYIPFVNISYYKKIIRINSKYYSNLVTSKKFKLDNKYITLCDSPMAHEDFIIRDGPYEINKVENYYKNLNLFLISMEKIFNKKVIICLHPKGEYNHFKNFRLLKKNFKTAYYKTEYYISKSFLVLNVISSTINNAIIHNKPIIILYSKFFGNTVKGKLNNISKELNLPMLNIDEFEESDIKKCIKKKYINRQGFYKKNRLFFKKNVTDINQIVSYLKSTN